jgi:hypothetical protein
VSECGTGNFDVAELGPSDVVLDGEGRDVTPFFVVWRELADHPGYLVGSNGSIWSRWIQRGSALGPIPGHWRLGVRWRRLGTTVDKDGYPRLALARADGQSKVCLVHHVVAAAFLGPRPEGKEICHGPDPDKANNDVRNLRYGSPADNAADRVKHGTQRGERNGAAKLDDARVRSARVLRARGVPAARIAELFRVSVDAVRDVLTGRTWKHVK